MSKKKIYLVESLECGGDGDTDFIVGACLSKKNAEKLCAKLEAENTRKLNNWNTYGHSCIAECEAWDSDKDPKAIESLAEARMHSCPYAKELRLKELFYGKENLSGGFEIVCDHKADFCDEQSELRFITSEVELLDEDT